VPKPPQAIVATLDTQSLFRPAKMTDELLVREVPTSEYGEWRRVLAAADEGSPYQLPEYLQALSVATNGDTRLLGVYRERELLGGMGLYLSRTTWGTIASSRLLLYYNGPFVTPCTSRYRFQRERHRARILRALQSHLSHAGYRRVRFKARHPQSDYRTFLEQGWTAKPIYTYVIHFGDLERAWHEMENNLRRLVRRCETNGFVVTDCGSCDAFLDMHEETSRRKDAPMYLPRQEFRHFIESLRAAGIVTLFQVSSADGTPAATQLVLHSEHPVAHTLSAGCTESAIPSGCNALLRWRVCQWLSNRGYQSLDLTDAHSTSVARFKSQLGAEVHLGLQLELPPHWSLQGIEQFEQLGQRVLGKFRQIVTGGRR